MKLEKRHIIFNICLLQILLESVFFNSLIFVFLVYLFFITRCEINICYKYYTTVFLCLLIDYPRYLYRIRKSYKSKNE